MEFFRRPTKIQVNAINLNFRFCKFHLKLEWKMEFSFEILEHIVLMSSSHCIYSPWKSLKGLDRLPLSIKEWMTRSGMLLKSPQTIFESVVPSDCFSFSWSAICSMCLKMQANWMSRTTWQLGCEYKCVLARTICCFGSDLHSKWRIYKGTKWMWGGRF